MPSSWFTSSAVIRSSADGQQLLEQRLAVAHRAGRPAGEDLQRLGLDLDALGRGDLREPRLDRAARRCRRNRTAGSATGS